MKSLICMLAVAFCVVGCHKKSDQTNCPNGTCPKASEKAAG